MIEISLPLSKSVALRALAIDAVNRLAGFSIDVVTDSRPVELLREGGCADISDFQAALSLLENASDEAPTEIFIGDGAAPLRFLMAIAASIPGREVLIVRSEQLARRPVEDFIGMLRDAGADVELLPDGKIHIRGRRLSPGAMTLDASRSSQYISALLMAERLWTPAPQSRIRWDAGSAVSTPYIDMTRSMLRRAAEGEDPFAMLEADWSAASYFYEWALLNPGIPLLLRGLKSPEVSLQGDSACARLFQQLGVVTEFTPEGALVFGHPNSIALARATKMRFRLTDTPDLVPALAVGMSAAGFRYRLEGISHLKYKESDRLEAIACELARVGLRVDVADDSLQAERAEAVDVPEDVCLSAHGDHRMAMALAVAFPDVQLEGRSSVAKSFPDFWERLALLTRPEA